MHLSAFLTAGTGLLYGWLRYFGQRPGEFGPEAHPAQALLQHLHILTAPLLAFTLGVLVRGHVQPMLHRGAPVGRASGLAMIFVLAPMILSGYLVQVATEPAWRVGWAWVHGIASLLFLLGYAVHQARTWEQARLDRAAELD
jgi:hypothetical protein